MHECNQKKTFACTYLWIMLLAASLTLHACMRCAAMETPPILQAVHAASVPAVMSRTKVWSISDLQAAILMMPGPFTTSRTVQRKVPRCHQLFAIENTPQAMKQLQAHGLGVAIQTRQNQTTYHKPLPTDENRSLLQSTLAPNHSWADYITHFSSSSVLLFSPAQFNALLASSPYAAYLKDKHNIEPVESVPPV